MKWLKRFTSWYLGDDDRERIPPRTGWRRVLYLLWNYGGRLILINLVFLVCCIPVVTIPSAVTALKRYLFKMYRDGYGFGLPDFFREFKEHFVAKLAAGLISFLLCFYGYYLMSLAGNFGNSDSGAFLTGLGYGIFFLGAAYGAWIFHLFAVLTLPLGAILRNAAILMIVEWKETVKTIVTIAVFVLLAWMLLPYSVFFLILFGFSLPELLIGACLTPAVERRIFLPYEEQGKEF